MDLSTVAFESPSKKYTIQDTKGPSGKCHFDWKKSLRRKVPITEWLPQYTVHKFAHDLLAGFTVALTEIPQSMAYAGIAGLPVQYGLYTTFMGGFVYAIFGSCKAINMGSTSIMALLIQPYVATMGVTASIFASFICGVVILIFGVFNFGFVMEFFSYPIMAGFTSAAALTISSSQIKNFLGIKGKPNQFLESWKSIVANIHKANVWDALLGVVCLTLLFFLKEISVYGGSKSSSKIADAMKKMLVFLSVAKNAIIVILGTTAAYLLKDNGYDCFQLTGEVKEGFPDFDVFPLLTENFKTFVATVEKFGVSILFMSLIAILETIAVAKVFSKGKTLDSSQEMIALGIANIMGSFTDSMPVTGSFSRTAVNNGSGAQTNMSAVFTGVTILIAIRFLTHTFYYIPKAAQAAVIICAMFYLFDFRAFALFWKSNKLDFAAFIATLLSSLFIGLEYGMLFGMATNSIFVLYSIARPNFKLEIRKLPYDNRDIYLITPPGTIYFPAAEYLQKTILKYDEYVLIIISGEYIETMDTTVAKSLSDLTTKIKSKNQQIVFLNFKKSVQEICIGLNEKLKDHFKVGQLEDVIEDGAFRIFVPRRRLSVLIER